MADSSCPVCSNARSVSLDRPTLVPILMNSLSDTRDQAHEVSKGPLALLGCRHCGFVWNSQFDSELIEYDDSYENDQSHSKVFLNHLEERARAVISIINPPEMIDCLEIGCGQGKFFGIISKMAEGRLRSIEGFDPAWRGREGQGPHGSRIHRSYFGRDSAALLTQTPNVVITRHTIEHVPKPLEFLNDIRTAFPADTQASIVVETPCVDWILKNNAMQDFFYEHCSLFNAASLTLALNLAGFEDVKISHVFGGQYLWAVAKFGQRLDNPNRKDFSPPREVEHARKKFGLEWAAKIRSAAQSGPVVIWGAGAKGVTFALMVDPDNEYIDCAVDINPNKQGKFLSGSGVAVVSPEVLRSLDPATIFIMNPNYFGEVAEFTKSAQPKATLISIE